MSLDEPCQSAANCPFAEQIRELPTAIRELRDTVHELKTRLEERDRFAAVVRWVIGVTVAAAIGLSAALVDHIRWK